MAWTGILHALWVFLPAYVANMSPVFAAKIVPRWSAPIDGGRMHRDGQRVLGPGKTWRGLAGGALFGAATAVAVAAIAPPYTSEALWNGWDYGQAGFEGGPIGSDGDGAPERAAWWAVALFGAVLGFMALAGDAVKSYFKRRRQKDRGAPWVPFDQLDFVVFGLLGMVLAAPLLPSGWVAAALLDDWVVLATLLLLTPVLHFLVNVIGFWLKLKEVPW